MDLVAESAASPSLLRRLLLLAWPVVVQRATQAVIGLADAVMVAPLGEASLAAVTTGGLDAFVVIILPMGTVFIVQSFAAQLSARGQWMAAKRYAWYGLLVAGVAAGVGVLAMLAVPASVAWLGYSPQVSTLLSTYLTIRLLSVGPAVATEVLCTWYGGLGNTRLAMRCGVTAMVANLVLNYLLIEPRWGLPGFGVGGAAAASVAASCIGLFPAAYAFLAGLGLPQVLPPSRLQWAELRRMLRFGLPNGVNWFLEFGAFVLFINLVIGHLGTSAMAAFNVVLQLSSVAFMPAFGIGSGVAILVGEAIGAGDKDRVPKIVRMGLSVTGVWMGSVGLSYVLVPEWLMSFFDADSGSQFTAIGIHMLIYGCIWQLFDALGITLGESLRAAGDTAWPMWVRIVLAWGLFLPGSWWLVIEGGRGVDAAMGSVVAYMGLLSVALIVRFLSGRWRAIQLVEEPVLEA